MDSRAENAIPNDSGRTPAYAHADEASALSEFERRCPAYVATASLGALRSTQYARLDRLGHTYLDYTGAGLYAESQLAEHHRLLSEHVLGNPHSTNPTSLAATHYVDEARQAVHEFFNASPDEYDVVFTYNASHALKLVGEAYPFERGSCYLVSYDNHNSVNGIREYARRGGADVVYVPVRQPDLRLDADLVMRGLERATDCEHKLFAYPAQSNFSGVQHPLEWIGHARALGWDVLLDAAAFAPTNRLDLAAISPDFVTLSFYKMFGYPTGAGALIARRDALAKLRRPWFAGGTITLASVQGDGWYHLAPGHTGYEDGTLDFLGLPAVTIGLRHLTAVGTDAIHSRVMALTEWLLLQMNSLRHSNGAPLIRIFGPPTTGARGATIAFYVLSPDGNVLDVDRIERLAAEERISIRTGCFCNPGDGEVAHSISRDEMASCFEEPELPVTFQQCHALIKDSTGKTPNTIRVSLGIASNFADVYRFMRFLVGLRDHSAI